MQKEEENKPVAETFEAELASIKEKGKDLKGTSRDFYVSIVQRLENNEQVLADLRKEHTALRDQLRDVTKEKSKRTRDTDLPGEIKRYTHKVNLLKKQIDNLKHKKLEAVNRQQELQIQLDHYNSVGTVDTGAGRIVSLRNKLDNAEIKNQETTHLMKVYNQIAYQLERQKMRWNSLVEAQKKEIDQKRRDLADLELIAKDSQHSKNAAYIEFTRLQEKNAAARERRNQLLQSKVSQVHQNMHLLLADDNTDSRTPKTQQSLNSQASVLRNRNNRAVRDKKDEKFRSVSAKYEEIQEYFGTNDPEEIKKFFDERKATTETLNKQINELKEDCAVLEKQVAQRRSAIEEAEYTSAKGVGGARLLNEANKILYKNEADLRDAEREVEAHKQFKKSLESGILHLTDEMQLVQKEPISFNSATEAIAWVKETIGKLKPSLEDEDFDFLGVCNQQVIAQKIAAESTFDIQHVDSSVRVPKPRAGDIFKRPQKGDKGEFVSRVQDRNAIKAAALKAAQARKEALAAKKKEKQ